MTSRIYRAAYLVYPDSGEMVLTGPEHADYPDAALRAEALAEAYRADLIGPEWPRVSVEDFHRYLTIGAWYASY
ncbi:hypothetical protein [Sulfobacillus sp. hq2]|uniref:hypothetical protein n=1 Tax=Sulfobacillus sp. hq2 TaxID=2039167 RepID=UPI000CD1F88E|nr:hypothetical protein [Sulfobacillus sp. hq2]POB12187.1 hypothetical protein CO251_00745 [Sulfobacillus sp. hq2]